MLTSEHRPYYVLFTITLSMEADIVFDHINMTSTTPHPRPSRCKSARGPISRFGEVLSASKRFLNPERPRLFSRRFRESHSALAESSFRGFCRYRSLRVPSPILFPLAAPYFVLAPSISHRFCVHKADSRRKSCTIDVGKSNTDAFVVPFPKVLHEITHEVTHERSMKVQTEN